ncbi:MAG: hypothetical protein HYV63_10090 [Candidatus Schekmanbacteria bacterium]|nr:hypothetical protein [Candidatus Schekmanbacteria bacterium]
MLRSWCGFALLGVALLAISPASAGGEPAPPPAGPWPGDRPPGEVDRALPEIPPERVERLFETVQTVKQMRLVARLNLDNQTAIRISRPLSEYDRLVFEQRKRARGFLHDLGAKLRDPATNDEEIKRLIAAAQAQEARDFERKRQLEGELAAVLSPKQLGQWLLFEEEFGRELDRTLRRLRGGRHQPGPPGERGRPRRPGGRPPQDGRGDPSLPPPPPPEPAEELGDDLDL